MARLRRLDPTTGKRSPHNLRWLKAAAGNGSTHGVFLYAQSLVAPNSPFETAYLDTTYDLIRSAAGRGHQAAGFYFADAVELGTAASRGEVFSCPELVTFYKSFAEDAAALNHLDYAFDELVHGRYKNALLGYLIAAEQGLANAQLLAAFLLHQRKPLWTWSRTDTLPRRVEAALRYLDFASSQDHADATILIGDMYASGVDGVFPADPEKAVAYYASAALLASPHACYKLGLMYEYGTGVAGEKPDYYMAKRYYDLSVKYYLDLDWAHVGHSETPNTYAVTWALLRLRLKLVLWGESANETESTGWLDTLKSLARSGSGDVLDENDRATAHAEGGSYEEEDEYQMFDYIVLIFTLVFFLYVGFQNLRRQFRGGNVQVQRPADAPRFQFEFFVAI